MKRSLKLSYIFFSAENRMEPAEPRSADGTFIWVGEGKEREESERRQKGEDKSSSKAMWKWPGHTRIAFMLLIPLGGATEKQSMDTV